MITFLAEHHLFPVAIHQAFKQLNISQWNVLEKTIYLEELANCNNVYQLLRFQERATGRSQGMIESAIKLLQAKTMHREEVITLLDLNTNEVKMMDSILASHEIPTLDNPHRGGTIL